MKILVTGAAGFIGFHLASSLLDDGHEVVGIDNFSDYYQVQLKRDRHALLEAKPNYRGYEIDICDKAAMADLFNQQGFERVCHLAAQAGVRYSVTHPYVYQSANLEGFLNILELCRAHKIQRLAYASSSSVYGGLTQLPFSETNPVDTPISLYAATKKANELMAHSYSHLYGIQTVGLRFFTVYGPWNRPDMAVWKFTQAMLARKPIQVFNNGEMFRDFTFVDDIVDGTKAAIFVDGLAQYEIINLGNHRAEKLMDMVNIMADCLGVKPEIDFQPLQPGDVVATFADIAKARNLLGFEPRTSIAEGIPRFINWYREYHKIQNPA